MMMMMIMIMPRFCFFDICLYFVCLSILLSFTACLSQLYSHDEALPAVKVRLLTYCDFYSKGINVTLSHDL